MSNFNNDIIIKEIHKSEFYDGIILQSSGNIDEMFEIYIKNDEWFYRAIYTIPERRLNYFYIHGDNKDVDNGKYKIKKIENGTENKLNDFDDWYQTLYTRRVDKRVIREEKLKILL